jgi:hypothetical protein
MNNNEIDPKLKKQLKSLQDIPVRDLQQSHIGKEKFLSRAKNIQPRRNPARAPKSRVGAPLRKSLLPRLAAILAVALFALTSIGGTVYAAQGSLPDDLLYPLKTLTEDIQIRLESDPAQRLDLYTSFANRRLEEIEAQVLAGKEVSPKALARLEKLSEKMLQQAAQVGENGLENALRQVQQAFELQNQVMTKLQKQIPGPGEQGLVQAQEKINSQLQLVENGLLEPQGFQEQMQIEGSDQGNKNGSSDAPGNSEDTPGQSEEGNSGSENGNGSGGK